jgi:acyl-CoA thioester hydrolase
MSEYPFTCEISVRTGDIDANRHVNNTVYSDYLEQARASYFRGLWEDDWGDSSVVVATMTIDFLAPIELDEEVYVDVRVSDVGTSSWTVEYQVRAVEPDGTEKLAAEGSSVHVAWDRENSTSQPLPESWKAKLEGELVAPEA